MSSKSQVSLEDVKKKYDEYFEALKNEVRESYIHFEIWKSLYEATAEYNKEINIAPCFFGTTMYAHLKSALLHIFRVIDKSNDSLSIWKFLDFVKGNTNIFSTSKLTPEKVEEDIRKLDELEETIGNLRKWRNKKVAHLDLKKIGTDITKEYPVKPEEFQKLIQACGDTLDRYSQLYSDTSFSLTPVGEDDWRLVLEAIRRYVNTN